MERNPEYPNMKPDTTLYFTPKKYRCPKCNGKLITDGHDYWCDRCYWELRPKRERPNIFQRTNLWLNNKKSIIGLGTVGMGYILSFWIPPLGEGVKYLGWAVLGSGAVHKVAKAIGKKKTKKGEGGIPWAKILSEIFKLIVQWIKKREKKGGD